MSRTVTVIGLAGALVLSVTASSALAQEATGPAATPSPMCGVLLEAEIEESLGEALPVADSGARWCGWNEYATGGNVGLWISLDHGRLSDIANGEATASPTEVAGSRALLVSDPYGLYVEANGGLLSIGANTAGADPSMDVPAALRSLAEAAMGRISSIELPPPPTPFVPTVVGDPELAALFPDTVDGEALGGFSTSSSEQWLARFDPNDPDAQAYLQSYTDVLATQGKTLGDISTGSGFFGGLQRWGQVHAMRVRGADMASMMDGLLPLEMAPLSDFTTSRTRVAGRDVLRLSTGPDADLGLYAYAKDDVLWIVVAAEPELSEVFGQLP